jgi:hypothetical protein
MVLATPTVLAEEFLFCWLFSESILTRAIEGHPFLPRFVAFFRDHGEFTFGEVKTVEDYILGLLQKFCSNIGIEDWSEYSQDNGVPGCANCRERADPGAQGDISWRASALQRGPISVGFPAQRAWSARKRISKFTSNNQEMAAVPLQNFAAIEKFSMQIRQICGYNTSVDSNLFH